MRMTDAERPSTSSSGCISMVPKPGRLLETAILSAAARLARRRFPRLRFSWRGTPISACDAGAPSEARTVVALRSRVATSPRSCAAFNSAPPQVDPQHERHPHRQIALRPGKVTKHIPSRSLLTAISRQAHFRGPVRSIKIGANNNEWCRRMAGLISGPVADVATAAAMLTLVATAIAVLAVIAADRRAGSRV